MDWQHGTMRFELCDHGIESIKSQYNNFNLSWINLPYYLKEHEVFIGDLSKLGSIDPTLVTQFEKNKIKYIACIVVKDQSGYPIGVFGLSWSDVPQNIDSLRPKIYNYLVEDSADIRPLIQINSLIKK